MLLDDPHYDKRHWQFVWQSIQDLNEQLAERDCQILVALGEVQNVLSYLLTQTGFDKLISHEEVGIDKTFQRDRALQQWCQENGVDWQEFADAGIIRGLTHRKNWLSAWRLFMQQEVCDPELASVNPYDLRSLHNDSYLDTPLINLTNIDVSELFSELSKKSMNRQPGGEKRAWHVLRDFLKARGEFYQKHISKPALARIACSRLSPYLAWGNISSRQVYQTIQRSQTIKHWSGVKRAFLSRIQWRSHFIQKFESECRMEFAPVNRGYDHYPYSESNTEYMRAWKSGNTGLPMIDACMRAVCKTGYLNFRMRAMLVSFLTHHMNMN